MNKNIILKTIAAVAALSITAAMLAGCSNKPAEETTDTSSETTTEISVDVAEPYTKRAVAEGDVYAINKFTVNNLPANYELALKSQENQGRIYLNGVSKITVMATNYKEDLTDLASYADTSCASLRLNNMLFQSDTDFSEPENTKVAGFDAIKYDYDITVNEFIKENEDDEGDGVKTPVGWYKSRIYFFYSDKDAYYVLFETTKDDWDATIGGFEEFVAGITIDENAVNDEPAESETVTAEEILEETLEESAAE